MTQQPNDSTIDFALKLGRALQVSGAPSHRLEEAMSGILESIGLEGEFFSTPTAIFASLGSGKEKRIELIRIASTDYDLTKLSRLNDLTVRVASGRMSPAEGSREIDEIEAAPPAYGAILTTICFALTSGAASRFFGAGLIEIGLAIAAGLIVGLTALLASRMALVGRLFDPLAGFLVSFFAVGAATMLDGTSVTIVTVAGLIVLVPGFTLTVAVNELAQRNLISGASRLSGAVIVFLMIGFGVAAGGFTAQSFSGPIAPSSPDPLPAWTVWIAVLFAAVTLSVLFRAPARDFTWVILCCGVTYLGVSEGSRAFGPEFGVFIGAIGAGVFSNLHARILRRPAAVTRVPAMMLLVPGGLGFIGISSLLDQNIVEGIDTAFRVALVAVALVTGF
ncbi:MAG: threonine/serine exporter family protein, partial [Thermoanaerobaculia bacterium]|nr:threonine/serine exporter family protein [Thermoanaerobaculia bacterium]